jgi:hydroxymethylpyrimidine kinase/phosphomethylpyrimidine kinase
VKAVLTIAGHDPSNGAGITKDLEVFASFGLHGLSVPTCFVIQGPRGASDVTEVADELFSLMLTKIREDFSIAAVKIGVLLKAYQVRCLADFLSSLKAAAVVLDPVRTAKNGLGLMTDEAQRDISEILLPHVTCITPNLDEASKFVGREISDPAGMEWAARELVRRGAKYAIIKGGHLAGEPADLLFDGKEVTISEKKRVARNVHGTGCLFSSTLLSFLTLDYPIVEAFRATGLVIERLLKESTQPLDDGYYYVSPVTSAMRGGGRWWESYAATGNR